MEAVKTLIMENKVLFGILVAMIILTIFATVKANKAVKATNERKKELIKKLDHLKMLRENYSEITKDSIISDSGEFLLEGVASNIQLNLEKSEDMNAEFENLCEEKKLVYTANYFLEDGIEKASNFFKEYSEPLTLYIEKAVKLFAGEEASHLVGKLCEMYDEENEEVSYIEGEIEEIDKKLSELITAESFKQNAAEYIKNNCEMFV